MRKKIVEAETLVVSVKASHRSLVIEHERQSESLDTALLLKQNIQQAIANKRAQLAAIQKSSAPPRQDVVVMAEQPRDIKSKMFGYDITYTKSLLKLVSREKRIEDTEPRMIRLFECNLLVKQFTVANRQCLQGVCGIMPSGWAYIKEALAREPGSEFDACFSNEEAWKHLEKKPIYWVYVFCLGMGWYTMQLQLAKMVEEGVKAW